MEKKFCIFVSSHVPSPNIPIAGQRTAYKNLQKLCKTHHVILIAFINKTEEQYYDDELYNNCFKTHFFHIRLWDRIKGILHHLNWPVRVSPRYLLKINYLIKSYLQEYPVSIFHSEFTASMSYVDIFPKEVFKEVVEQDIVFQSFDRYCQNKRFPQKLLYCFEYNRQKKWELEYLRKFDKIVVLNEKDYSLIEQEEIKNIEIAFPQVDDWCYQIKRNNIEPFSILFLGAMNRFENQDAVFWFVKNIFPKIIKQFKDTKLYVVGANPPDKIINLSSTNIEVTGYIDSLEPIFEKSAIAIAPLRYGAGIKIKTLETIAAKIPTVASDVGAEGIPEDKCLFIASSENNFEQIIISLFNNSKDRSDQVT